MTHLFLKLYMDPRRTLPAKGKRIRLPYSSRPSPLSFPCHFPFGGRCADFVCSSVMMLRHMSLNTHADKIEKAIFDTLAEGKSITGDLGGRASTSEYTTAIIQRLS